MSDILKQKIRTKKANIAIVGLGYVGLPLAIHFAKKGFKVFGLDKDKDRVERLKRKESYIRDVSSWDVSWSIRTKALNVSTHFDPLAIADVIIICVPTPLKRKYTPDISYILDGVKTIRKFIKQDTLVVLESTTYPGTTEELIKPELEKSGLRAEKDFYISFSPERIDPGNRKYDLTKIPKVVGGLSKKSTELTRLLYQTIIKKVYVVSSAKTAEMTKLLENTFRIVNIGWVNEAAMMCHQLGIDIWEVIETAKTKPFGFMPFYPGLGVGGHCIPDDPLYLYWKAKLHGYHSRFIKLAAEINSFMSSYAVNRLREILNGQNKRLEDSRILVIGVTYKKDVKDLRKSPPLRFIELLQRGKCHVSYFDPIIPYLDVGTIQLRSVDLTKKNLSRFDCVVIAVDHTEVDYPFILRHARLIFDIRNIYRDRHNKKVMRF